VSDDLDPAVYVSANRQISDLPPTESNMQYDWYTIWG
jgi:hypothetical protein